MQTKNLEEEIRRGCGLAMALSLSTNLVHWLCNPYPHKEPVVALRDHIKGVVTGTEVFDNRHKYYPNQLGLGSRLIITLSLLHTCHQERLDIPGTWLVRGFWKTPGGEQMEEIGTYSSLYRFREIGFLADIPFIDFIIKNLNRIERRFDGLSYITILEEGSGLMEILPFRGFREESELSAANET
jgi:hypothetical protein